MKYAYNELVIRIFRHKICDTGSLSTQTKQILKLRLQYIKVHGYGHLLFKKKKSLSNIRSSFYLISYMKYAYDKLNKSPFWL